MSDNQAGNWLEGQVAYIVYEPKSLIITMREREGQS